MNQSKSQFKENYHGVLTHDGFIKVMKSYITAEILNMDFKNGRVTGILVKGNNSSYHVQIHKNMQGWMDFIEVGDTAVIKFKGSTAYLVGYRKKNYDKTPAFETGDFEANYKLFNRIDGE